jgi:hypothetical protein
MKLGEIEAWCKEAFLLLESGDFRELTILQAIFLAVLIFGLIGFVLDILKGVIGFIGDLLEGLIESELVQNNTILFIIILILISVLVFFFIF